MMFHRGLIVTLLSSLIANAAHGAALVKAGEHGTYSRIVIPGVLAGWGVATNGRSIEISLPGALDFDLTEVADKRKAHRVLSAKMSATENSRILKITLTCDCVVRAALSPQNSIIIDILEPSKTSSPPLAQQHEAATVFGGDDGARTPADLRAARDRMIALLAEANSSGVIKLRKDVAKDEPQNPSPDIGATALPITLAAIESDGDSAGNTISNPPGASGDKLHTVCIDPVHFYEDPESPDIFDYNEIAALRERMEAAADKDRHAAAIELAYLYLRIGFFEEARAAARSGAKADDGEMALIASLAELGGARNANAAEILAQFSACGLAYEVLQAAARKNLPGETLPPLSNAHIKALNSMMRTLRGPIAEKLALNALDYDNADLVKQFYDIALNARGSEQTPALTLLAAMLKTGETSADKIKRLKPIAQTSGPLQKRALGEIAKKYERDAANTYDGFLEDLAAQGDAGGETQADIRATVAGAKALFANGRISEAVNILTTLAKSSPAAREIGRSQARSDLMTLFSGEDDRAKFDAASIFLQHREFLRDTGVDHALSNAAARQFSYIGAVEAAAKAINNADDVSYKEKDAIAAIANLNAGDNHAALSKTKNYPNDPDMVFIAIRANEKMENNSAVATLVNSAARRGAMTDNIVRAAWRTRDWKLATSAYKFSSLSDGHERYTLAALSTGALAMPKSATDNIVDDAASAALTHMFTQPPRFRLRNLGAVSTYVEGVSKEIAFMNKGLNYE